MLRQYHLDENFGKGRIWRLRHKGFELGKHPRMLEETPAQLVKHLSHPNGWWRETAQKLLILKGDKSVKSELEKLVISGKAPEIKMHALWTLEGLGILSSGLISQALNDEQPRVRKAAIRASESVHIKGEKTLTDLIYAKLSDSDVNVKMQAVLTAKYLNLPDYKVKVDAATKDATETGLVLARNNVLRLVSKNSHGRVLSKSDSRLIKQGKSIYSQLCASCHGKDAKGQRTDKVMMAPALADSPRVIGDKGTAINIVMHGLTGEIDGKTYPGGLMIPMGTNGDKWIASVLSYVRTHFGNRASIISQQDVKNIRKSTKNRKTPWTLPELNKSYSTLLTNKKYWKLTASHGQKNVKGAVDGNWNKRYDSAGYQAAGMWFQIELPKVETLDTLIFDAGPSQNDYPKGFIVETSIDGKNWNTTIDKGKGTTALTEINMKDINAKFIKVTLTEAQRGKYWSIHALDILKK